MDDWSLVSRLGIVAATLGVSVLIAFGLHEFERWRQRRTSATEIEAWGRWSWDEVSESAPAGSSRRSS